MRVEPGDHRQATLVWVGIAFGAFLGGCVSLPGTTSDLSLNQSVSALTTVCGAHSASGQASNTAKVAVRVDLKITWLSVTNSTLATGTVSGLKVAAHGQASFSAHPDKTASNALSCTATVTNVHAA